MSVPLAVDRVGSAVLNVTIQFIWTNSGAKEQLESWQIDQHSWLAAKCFCWFILFHATTCWSSTVSNHYLLLLFFCQGARRHGTAPCFLRASVPQLPTPSWKHHSWKYLYGTSVCLCSIIQDNRSQFFQARDTGGLRLRQESVIIRGIGSKQGPGCGCACCSTSLHGYVLEKAQRYSP